MSSGMFRRCMIVAVAAVVAAAPVSAAKGGPEKSRFAGTYASSGWSAPIAISDGGQISSSIGGSDTYKATISGRVYSDGSYSYTLTETYMERGPRDHGRTKTSYEAAGTLALDADGNIVGTPSTGGSFTWLRQ